MKHSAFLSLGLDNCSQWTLALTGEPFHCQSPLARRKHCGDSCELLGGASVLSLLSACSLSSNTCQVTVIARCCGPNWTWLPPNCSPCSSPAWVLFYFAATSSSDHCLELSEGSEEGLRSSMTNRAPWLSLASTRSRRWCYPDKCHPEQAQWTRHSFVSYIHKCSKKPQTILGYLRKWNLFEKLFLQSAYHW